MPCKRGIAMITYITEGSALTFKNGNGAEYAALADKYRGLLPESAKVGCSRANFHVGRTPWKYLEKVRFINKAGWSWDVAVSKEDAKADKARRTAFYIGVKSLQDKFQSGNWDMVVSSASHSWSMKSNDHYGMRISVTCRDYVLSIASEEGAVSIEYPDAVDFTSAHHCRQDGQYEHHEESPWVPKACEKIHKSEGILALELALYKEMREAGCPITITKDDTMQKVSVNGSIVLMATPNGDERIEVGEVLSYLKHLRIKEANLND
jgi:hypothetical protein